MRNHSLSPPRPARRRSATWLASLLLGCAVVCSPRLPAQRSTQAIEPRYDLVSVTMTASAVDMDVSRVDTDDYPDLVTLERPASGPHAVVVRANGTTGRTYSVLRTHPVPSFGTTSSRIRTFVAGADGRRNDIALFDDSSLGHALDIDNPTASFSFVARPASVEMPVSIDAALSGTTHVVAVAYEGNPFDQNGGAVVRVGTGPATVLTSTPTRRKFTAITVRDLDNDSVVDVAAQGPGYTTLWKGIQSGPSVSFSPAGELTSTVLLTDGLTTNLVDADTHPDLISLENDIFSSTPRVDLVVHRNAGTGALGPGRFTRSSFVLSSYLYGRSALFADRYDTDDTGGLSQTRSFFVSDAGRNQLRCTQRLDASSLTLLAGDPADHLVVSGVNDRRGAVADMDCNGTDDLVVARDTAIDVSLACHFPTSDILGVQSGSTSISVQGSPTLGGAFDLRVTADQPGRLVGYMLGTGTTDTLISPGNHLYIDPSSLLCVKLAFTQAPGNDASMSLTVPPRDALLGKKLATQAFAIKQGTGAHAGFADLTKVVHQTIGKTQ